MLSCKKLFERITLCCLVLLPVLLAACGGSGTDQSATTSSSGAAASAQASPASANITMTDMLNRSVTIPSHITRILALHPIPSFVLWRLAPDKQVSVDMVFQSGNLTDSAPRYYSDADLEKLKKLPVTGVYFKGLDPEQVAGLKPDLVITMTGDPQIDRLQQQLSIPFFAVSKAPLDSYEETIRLLGKIVGNEADANKMADFWTQTIQEVTAEASKIPDDQRPKVLYVGKGNDILATPGKDTVFGSSIDLAGGKNLGDQLANPQNESNAVSPEQILEWNPDVIIAATETAKQRIMGDPAWQSLNAVKNGKVYVPSQYGGLDGIQAIMGLVWTQGILLHGNDAASQATFANKMQAFYSLFYKREITPEEIAQPAK